jgi:hypothetical protein
MSSELLSFLCVDAALRQHARSTIFMVSESLFPIKHDMKYTARFRRSFVGSWKTGNDETSFLTKDRSNVRKYLLRSPTSGLCIPGDQMRCSGVSLGLDSWSTSRIVLLSHAFPRWSSDVCEH